MRQIVAGVRLGVAQTPAAGVRALESAIAPTPHDSMTKPPRLPLATVNAGVDSLKRLILLRGLALLGMGAMMAAARPLFQIVVPMTVPLLLLFLWATLNLLSWLRLRHPSPVGDEELLAQLGLDLVMLTVLLALSGGPANPLTALYLPLVAVAAAILPARHAWAIACTSVLGYSLLWKFSVVLTVEDVDRAMQMHLTGMWLTFALSALLIAGFVTRITASLRKREQQLAAARELALRDERIVALGNLAAGAAHELGTPLATMAVLAGELAGDPATPQAQRDDLQLLRQQIAACKRIISGLAASAGAPRAEEGGGIAVDLWIDEIVAHWRILRPGLTPRLSLTGVRAGSQPPQIFGEATLEQALLSVFNNAADASPTDVEIAVSWTQDWLSVEVLDRGPGLEPALLERAGREFFSTRPEGAGIGLFLAHAAIDRHGGRIALEPRAGGGTVAHIELPLKTLAEDLT